MMFENVYNANNIIVLYIWEIMFFAHTLILKFKMYIYSLSYLIVKS